MLEICIEDNGIGRKAAAMRNKTRNGHEKSMGMKLTTDRIALIENMLDISASVHINDLKDSAGQAAGTQVTITIPRLDALVMAKEKHTA